MSLHEFTISVLCLFTRLHLVQVPFSDCISEGGYAITSSRLSARNSEGLMDDESGDPTGKRAKNGCHMTAFGRFDKSSREHRSTCNRLLDLLEGRILRLRGL